MSIDLVLVMPAYNEEECIEEVIKTWLSFLQGDLNHIQTKLIVVNDGSKDKTGAILDNLKDKNPDLIVYHRENGGHGNAVFFGYQQAVELNAEYIFQVDSDNQFVAKDLLKLWAKRNESDFILGFRQVRNDAPFRLLITRILKYSIFLIYGTYIHDSNVPFRLIEANFLKKMLSQLPKPTPFAPNIFLSIMAKKAGKNLFDIPITHQERDTGEVSIRKMKLLKVCWQSFKDILNFRIELNNIIKYLK
ncbi:MAG: glycosyltransferase family 2 protein [Spirosomaceae bacterium]|nr:glycosyltransferase family 2 protein [Spirosomataceae bacterium]MDP5139998.1 glycosyltransferase family 2 protein [Spirosomataceae bacterium]